MAPWLQPEVTVAHTSLWVSTNRVRASVQADLISDAGCVCRASHQTQHMLDAATADAAGL
jgi:hypothetical protein